MYDASVPVFKQLLNALILILDKAETHVMHTKAAPETLLNASLFPDMFNLIRQVQIGSDFAKGVSARLAGFDIPTFEDVETNFHELRERITKTMEFISSISPEAFVGSEAREIITRPGTAKEKKFTGINYLLHYGLPQFFFHVTTAYDILRSRGVEIGKLDYMGAY